MLMVQILIFIFLTIIWTYPLIFRLSTSIFADSKWLFDTLVAIYGTWWHKMAWLGKVQPNFNNLLGYPFGIDISMENKEPVLEIPLLFLSLWKNEIFAFNIIILSSFILSGITMYCLAWYFTKNRTASFISAVVYAFCPYHSLQCFSHMSLAVIQWMPLYILSLFKFAEKISYFSGVLCIGSFLLVAFSNYYYAYMMFIFTIIFSMFVLYKQYKMGISYLANLIKKLSLMGFIITVVLLTPNYKAIIAVWKSRTQSTISEEFPRYARPLSDVFRYSARLTDYIRPSEYHPIFGKIDFLFIKPYRSASRHWAERTVFLGYTPIMLSLYFIIRWLRRKKKLKQNVMGQLSEVDSPLITDRLQHNNTDIYIIIFSTITAFLISLPPKLGFIPMPNFFLFKLFPMFRSYARFGIIVILGFSIFSGMGFREIILKTREKVLYTSIITGLILFEFIVIPPFRNLDFTKTPPLYEWVKRLPSDTAVAEYPLFSEIESDHYKYLFYQRIHEHPLFNGMRIWSKADAIRTKIMDISKENSADILSSLDIKYVIIHKDKYKEQGLLDICKNRGLEVTLDFGDSIVYKVVSTKKKTTETQRFRGHRVK